MPRRSCNRPTPTKWAMRHHSRSALPFALAKFGPHIRLRGGSEEYNNMMADVAADAGLYVEFSDKVLQDRYSQRREATQAGRPSAKSNKAATSRVNFDLDRDQHTKLKVYAAKQGKTVKEVLTELVAQLHE